MCVKVVYLVERRVENKGNKKKVNLKNVKNFAYQFQQCDKKI